MTTHTQLQNIKLNSDIDLNMGKDCEIADNSYAHAEGNSTSALADYSHTDGFKTVTKKNDDYSFVWSGDDSADGYASHGKGTISIKPQGALSGIYVNDTNLMTILDNFVDSLSTAFSEFGLADDVWKAVKDSYRNV